jgi:MOSC domain-containing protein YiiM|tara:strand:- start:12446 stop:13108 length:663 start_codon:yes stop_codon:yes gene_type:complete
MKILSINVSLPKKIVFKNKSLTTSIFKEPTNRVIKLKKIGLDGDKQADLKSHGGPNKALYLYSYQHYKYWGDILKKDFSNNYGLIGENITVDELDEEKYFIGDEIGISNVVIKITQPRIPCYKLGIKMNDKNFVREFISYGHLGLYAKVLKTGEIKNGDALKLLHREENTMTVYNISRLLFDKDVNIEELRRAVKINCLSEEIKTRFNERLAKLGYYENI